ncbi:hypothetical protein Csac_1878 [Caldicellulosiruptor saccharolyticus DSM 8903]|uniref:Phospho-N-acetylmuramoyl-pentapeptide-transferase n=2 Tax=Caldicellulosiruptor saccharolyticus TaxID=44001 RepID=A4XKM8_CALS8|nr:hypothetical protein Csac_1878 [Caldicellulosiruptor saccharolyticus DSM 8903]
MSILTEILFLHVSVMYFKKKERLLKQNYKGKKIPCGIGIVLGFVSAFYTFFIYYYVSKINFLVIGLSFLAISAVGFIDDIFGDNRSKGFKGHIKRLFNEHELSTGLLKMIVIPFVLFTGILYLTEDMFKAVLYTIFGSLSVNLFNLFDLRPGRCIKALFVFLVLFGFFINWSPFCISLLILLVPIFIGDIKEVFMLGDAGSNLIGYIFFIITSELYSRSLNSIVVWIALLIVAALNLASEYISFSEVIEKNKILKYIDDLGRKN